MSSTPEQDTATAPETPAGGGNTALIARQAIVDEHRAVFGYELYDRSTELDSHTAASDAALLFNALSHGDAEALAASMIEVGREMGVEVAAVLNPMHEPLGRTVGNSLEVIESLDQVRRLAHRDRHRATGNGRWDDELDAFAAGQRRR